jgi:tetratricopeptide (TPR) repeat protein
VAFDDEVMRTLERVLGGLNHLPILQSLISRAEETLRILERVLGSEHPDTLISRNNLAAGYQALGRYQEAVQLLEETLRVQERVLGPEHPDTLISRNNLAIGYFNLDRHQEAVELYEETLRISERVLGSGHPDTLISRNSLAVELDKETLRILERVLGPEHPHTLKRRQDLAAGYQALGRSQEAAVLEEENRKIYERMPGPEYPDAFGSGGYLPSYFPQGGLGGTTPLSSLLPRVMANLRNFATPPNAFPPFKVLLLHPRKLSKRLSSPFIVYIYPPEKGEEARVLIAKARRRWLRPRVQLEGTDPEDAELPTGRVVNIQISRLNSLTQSLRFFWQTR